MANPTTRAILVMSIKSHCPRLLARDDHAPVSRPRLMMLRRARLGPWFLSQLDEALKPPSGIRRSSTPRANREGTGENKRDKLCLPALINTGRKSTYYVVTKHEENSSRTPGEMSIGFFISGHNFTLFVSLIEKLKITFTLKRKLKREMF